MRLERNRQNPFYFIKTMRLSKGIEKIQIGRLMRYFKNLYISYIEGKIARDASIGEARLIDYNFIEGMLMISFTLKTIKLFIIIITFSFYFAMLFKILLEIEHDLYAGVEVGPGEIYYDPSQEINDCDDSSIGYFTKCYALGTMSTYNEFILLLYYSFTSLSTVGFGDYHPKSNLERFVIAFFLLFGVAIFSYIMSILIGIIEQFKNLNEPLDEGEQLNSFLNIIRKFNMGEEYRADLKIEIEEFFAHKWNDDKNYPYWHQDFQEIV